MPFEMPYQRSVVVACDVSTLGALHGLVSATCEIPHIGAYKAGFELVIPYGLPRVVEVVRMYTSRPVIYDQQKGGTDIPAMGAKFARAVKSSGADAAILFPLTGPVVAEKWIGACLAYQDEGLGVIVGGHMTHDKFLESDGGYITNTAPYSMYGIGVQLGVTNFVVPGNHPDLVQIYRHYLEQVGVNMEKLHLFALGFVTQGGNISEAGKVAGERWHAIVGSAIYEKKTYGAMRDAAFECVSQIIAAEQKGDAECLKN